MYQTLLIIHSALRWLVLIALVSATARNIYGWLQKDKYTRNDYLLRSITATIGHIQLVVGLILYFKSPVTSFFRTHFNEALQYVDVTFFGLFHIALMCISVLVLTIGSSLGKRQKTDQGKFRVTAIYFGISLLIIFLAIPWPFSPYVTRPYFRSF